MRASSFVQSATVGVLTAVAARATFTITLKLGKPSVIIDVLLMTVIGFCAAALFLAWKRKCEEVIRIMQERERARANANHEIRNALVYLMWTAGERDPEAKRQCQRIQQALEQAFPKPLKRSLELKSPPAAPAIALTLQG